MRKTENIFDTTLEILQMSDREDITSHQAAFNVAQQRIDTRKRGN
jgi:leucine dehydrogenase